MRTEYRAMASRKKQLFLDGMTKALRMRQSMGIPLDTSICIYDLAQKLGLDVWFMKLPKFEGVYCKGTSTIAISSLRPTGRQRHTCAHEVGHHVYGHSVKVDECLSDNASSPRFIPEEFLVDCFGDFLLMPKLAVSKAFNSRGINIQLCLPEDIYAVSCQFGVGYSSLITHMETNLKLLTSNQAKEFSKIPPKKIRTSIVGHEIKRNLFVIDTQWIGRPIDLEIGDCILVPDNFLLEEELLEFSDNVARGKLYYAVRPGCGHISCADTNWESIIRVSKYQYAGRAMYRYLEDPDHE